MANEDQLRSAKAALLRLEATGMLEGDSWVDAYARHETILEQAGVTAEEMASYLNDHVSRMAHHLPWSAMECAEWRLIVGLALHWTPGRSFMPVTERKLTMNKAERIKSEIARESLIALKRQVIDALREAGKPLYIIEIYTRADFRYIDTLEWLVLAMANTGDLIQVPSRFKFGDPRYALAQEK